MLAVWSEEKDLDKAFWINQVVLSLQPFCSSIELLVFWGSNFKLCRSRQYYGLLTHFGSIFSFKPLESIKSLWFSDISKK